MSKTSDSFETFYQFKKVNKKNSIVFIHGVGLNNEIWQTQTNYFKDYNILTYDLPGHGKTPLKKTKLNFDDYIKQLLELTTELNLEKIHLVGFSLGALIARNFASTYNDKLSSLVLHGSIYKRTKDQERVVMNRFNVSKMNKEASKQGAIRRWFSEEFIKKNQDIYNKIYMCLKNNNLKNFLKSYDLFVNFKDDDDTINKINTNTLITTGENDVGSTPEMARNLSKKIKNSKVQIIKNGKHLCNIECAEIFNITIKKFIDKHA